MGLTFPLTQTIEKRLFNCVKKDKINFDCMQYEDEEDEILEH